MFHMPPPPPPPPALQVQVEHVVVVFLDDVGIDKVGAYGAHPTAGPTPVMDAMAAEGVLFRNAYSDPLCSPSRAAALTGRYGSRTGIGFTVGKFADGQALSGQYAPSDDLPWLPRMLAAGGVRSDAIGKWHLTHKFVPDYHMHPIRTGFAQHTGSLYNLGGAPTQNYYFWTKNIALPSGWGEHATTKYATLDSTQSTLAALIDAADKDQRSFVWLALNAAHKPWHVPPSGTFTPIPAPYSAPDMNQAIIEAADMLLGQLRDAWEQADPAAASRTLWLVMGDNGTQEEAVELPWPADHNKGELYEGGVHVPLIAYGAGVRQPGSESYAMVHVVDLWATVLDAFGVGTRGVRTDSVSFLGALRRPQAFTGRGWAYSRSHEPNGFQPDTRQHMACDGRWKLIEKDGVRRLYDLSVDGYEATDLYPPTTPEQSAAVASLSAVLAACDTPTVQAP
jgi:arylsulfatase A-like enzyme